MTKQEEIREGIRDFLNEWAAYLPCSTGGCSHEDCISDMEIFLDYFAKYLHSQGVVIKVEGELPKEICNGCSCYFKEKDKSILLERLKGYTLTEPLIKGRNGNDKS